MLWRRGPPGVCEIPFHCSRRVYQQTGQDSSDYLSQASTYQLLRSHKKKGESKARFARKRAPLDGSVAITVSVMALSIVGNKKRYLPVSGGRYLLKDRDCPDQTGHDIFEVQKGRSPGVFRPVFWIWSNISLSLSVAVYLCILPDSWEQEARRAAPPRRSRCSCILSFRRTWVTVSWKLWLAWLSESTLLHLSQPSEPYPNWLESVCVREEQYCSINSCNRFRKERDGTACNSSPWNQQGREVRQRSEREREICHRKHNFYRCF